MTNDLTDLSSILVRNEMTIGMWFFLYLTYYRRHDAVVAYQKMEREFYGKKLLTADERAQLFERGFVTDKGAEAGKYRYQVEEPFFKLFIPISQSSMELVNMYPAYATSSNGKKMPLLGVKTQQIQMMYEAAIGSNKEKHLFILDQIEYGKNNNFIFMKIDTFINQQMWDDIAALRGISPTGEHKSHTEHDF